MKTAKQQFNVGDNVVDRDGFQGTVSNVTHFDGSVWYDVRFARGSAVRYNSDLTIANDSTIYAS